MKKLLYILLTLSILSTGCSKEDDDIQPTQTSEVISNLDPNLYGNWNRELTGNYLTLSSNGKYVWGSTSGDWWVQQGRLLLHETGGDGYSQNDSYTISNGGTELYYDNYVFYKD